MAINSRKFASRFDLPENQQAQGQWFPSAPFQRGHLFWHYPHNRHEAAIRDGRHKLVYRFEEDRAELYDLETDIGEKHELSEPQPELTRRLVETLKEW